MRGVWGRVDTRICMAEALNCSPETITTLLIDLLQYKMKIFSWKRKYLQTIVPSSGKPRTYTRGQTGPPELGEVLWAQNLQKVPPKRPRVTLILSSGVKEKPQNKTWLPSFPKRRAVRDRVWSRQLAGALTRHEGLSLRCEDGLVNWALPGSPAPFCGAKDLAPRGRQPRKFSQQKLCHLLPDISKARGDTYHRWVGREGSRQEKKLARWGLCLSSQACCMTLGKWLCLSEPPFTSLDNEYKKMGSKCYVAARMGGAFGREWIHV